MVILLRHRKNVIFKVILFKTVILQIVQSPENGYQDIPEISV